MRQRQTFPTILAACFLLLCASCIKVLDVVVTNPCSAAGTMDLVTGQRPDERRVEKNLDAELLGTEVPASAERFPISGELSGDLPFEGGFGYVRWEGTDDVAEFRIPASSIEPIPVEVPRRLCPAT